MVRHLWAKNGKMNISQRIHKAYADFTQLHYIHPDKLTISEGLLFDMVNNDLEYYDMTSPLEEYMGMKIEMSSGEDVICVSHKDILDYKAFKVKGLYRTWEFEKR